VTIEEEDHMLQGTSNAEAVREPVLNPVDRITELLFGLLMALSFFVGAISVVPNTFALAL
jgi:hypothetical protein